MSYYRRFYVPNNATLVIAGDVTPDGVKALAETYYGPLEPSDGIVPRIRPQEPPQLAERRLVLEDERVSEPYVYRSYLAPERDPGNQREAAALTVLAELLAGTANLGPGARLAVRHADGGVLLGLLRRDQHRRRDLRAGGDAGAGGEPGRGRGGAGQGAGGFPEDRS